MSRLRECGFEMWDGILAFGGIDLDVNIVQDAPKVLPYGRDVVVVAIFSLRRKLQGPDERNVSIESGI